jgi:hypothetical protein
LSRHLLVIGAQRSGTTYLHTLLDEHPQVTMARPARPEPKVFLSAEKAGLGLDWYRRTFFSHARTELVLGEKSTSYLEAPQAAGRAREVLGDAAIVVLLRDPVDRAVSNWQFSTDNGFETRPLETALQENLAGSSDWDSAATSVSPFAYLERGRYASYLEPWWTVFHDSVSVVFLQELLDEPTTLQGLYATLGVDPSFRPSGVRTVVNQSSAPAPALPGDLRARLDDYFADANTLLSHRLGRNLPWPQPPTRSTP